MAKTQRDIDKKRQQQWEKRRLQQQQSQMRQQEKQRAKLSDPAHQQQLREKQQAAQQRQFERQQEKQRKPEYRQEQYEKQRIQLNKKAAPKPIKSRGLKGRNHTVAEKTLANKVAEIGCICCLNKGWTSSSQNQQAGQQFVSLHHIDGRSKAWAHAKVLPLCHFHHQTPPPNNAPEELFPIHGNAKTVWEKINGTQAQLLEQVYKMIGEAQPWLILETA